MAQIDNNDTVAPSPCMCKFQTDCMVWDKMCNKEKCEPIFIPNLLIKLTQNCSQTSLCGMFIHSIVYRHENTLIKRMGNGVQK